MTYKTNNTNTINPDASTSFNKIFVNRIFRTGGASGGGSSPVIGTVAAYSTGGYTGTPPYFGGNYYANTIDKFPLASSANATDTGDLYTGYPSTRGIGLHTSASSDTDAFTLSGASPFGGNFPFSGSTVIQSFSFASEGNSADTGRDLLATTARGGAGNSSNTHGYTSGGYGNSFINQIQKFAFATTDNATDVGDMTYSRSARTGNSASSPSFGYIFGGVNPFPAELNIIEKFPFAADTNASDVGDLQYARVGVGGHNSDVAAYASGGSNPYPYSYNYIEKVPFASDGNSVDTGDLTTGTATHGTSSSEDGGFRAGGAPFPTRYNIIDKFPFASDGNSVDYGDLTQGRAYIGTNVD